MGLKRYQVEAKRNVTWTEWTEADTYKKAKAHARYCESVGYTARIVADESVEELWDILGKSDASAEKVDAILDAGFVKESEAARKLFRRIYSHFTNRIQKCDRAIAKADFEEDAALLAKLEEEKEELLAARRMIADYGERYTGDSDES